MDPYRDNPTHNSGRARVTGHDGEVLRGGDRGRRVELDDAGTKGVNADGTGAESGRLLRFDFCCLMGR